MLHKIDVGIHGGPAAALVTVYRSQKPHATPTRLGNAAVDQFSICLNTLGRPNAIKYTMTSEMLDCSFNDGV